MEENNQLSILELPQEINYMFISFLDKPTKIILRFVCKLFSELIDIKEYSPLENDQFCALLVEQGNLKLLQWAENNGCHPNILSSNTAIRFGELEILEWIENNNYLKFDNETFCQSCKIAAINGFLDIFKYLEKKSHIDMIKLNLLEIAKGAAIGGHIEIFKFTQQYGFNEKKYIFVDAIVHGQLEFLKYLKNDNKTLSNVTRKIIPFHFLNVNINWIDTICFHAAYYGQLEILKWAHINGFFWDEDVCSGAAIQGHLEILIWLRLNGCPWNEITVNNAILYGKLENLIWILENGCPYNENMCIFATIEGHLEILQWLKSNGYYWKKLICYVAAKNGYLEILQWAIENGCHLESTICWVSIKSNHLHILQWAIKNGCKYDLDTLVMYAKQIERYEIVEWLLSLRVLN